MGLRFLHSKTHTPAKPEFDAHLRHGSEGIRLSVCFFLKAGFEILRRHTVALTHPESFVVVSLDFPTDLDAVDDLHQLIPGRVFIHLGWVTPEEKRLVQPLCTRRSASHAVATCGASGLAVTTSLRARWAVPTSKRRCYMTPRAKMPLSPMRSSTFASAGIRLNSTILADLTSTSRFKLARRG